MCHKLFQALFKNVNLFNFYQGSYRPHFSDKETKAQKCLNNSYLVASGIWTKNPCSLLQKSTLALMCYLVANGPEIVHSDKTCYFATF